MLETVGIIIGVLALVWAVYTYYKPRNSVAKGAPSSTELGQHNLQLTQSVTAEVVTDALIFLDWIQKNPHVDVRKYPTFISIRRYLPTLQSGGFIEQAPDSNLEEAIYQLTALGRDALISAGVKLI